MPVFFFLSIVLSGFVVSHMEDEDKTRYFVVLIILLLIIILPQALTGKL